MSPQINKASTQTQQGFTLIELLVALTIFAVLAAAGWQVFDQLQKTRERVGAQSERLSELQQAYMQINRDLTQIINRPVITASKQDAALTLSAQKLSFTKLAGIDPRFVQTTAFERVTYEVQENKLIRLVQKNLGSEDEQAIPVVLLADIDDLKFVALDPGVTNIWPSLEALSQMQSLEKNLFSAANPNGVGVNNDNQTDTPPKNLALTQLPAGIQIDFTLKGMGADIPILWRFAIPEPAPNVAAPKSTNDDKDDKGKEGGSGKGDDTGDGSQSGGQSESQDNDDEPDD